MWGGIDVGRSCVLVTVGGKNVMFDCGMHMGYQDERRFPDFAYISKERRFTELIDCLIVTHLYPRSALPPRHYRPRDRPGAALTAPDRGRRTLGPCTPHSHLDHCGALPYFTEMCG